MRFGTPVRHLVNSARRPKPGTAKPMLCCALLLCFALAAPPLPGMADSADDQLRALQAQEAQQRAAMSQLAAQQQAARTLLGQLRGDLNAKQADLAAISAQANALGEQLAAFEAREKSLADKHDSRVRAFSQLVRGLYKSGPTNMIAYVFSAIDFSSFLDRLIYVSTLARNNFEEGQRLKAEREALARDRQQTAQLKAALEPLLADLAARAAAAESAFSAQAAVESELESQQRSALSALLGTQRRERQLENALAAAQAAANSAARKGAGLSYGPVCPGAPPGKVSICGHGWGHGVGLAQYGALGMAQAGHGWQSIISTFYSGVSVGGIPESPQPPVMRVWLHAAGGTITPRLGGGTLEDGSGASLGLVGSDQPVQFSGNRDGSVSASWHGGNAKAKPIRLVAAAGVFQVSGSSTRYRGEAWVDNTTGFKVINHVNLEDYLQGLAEVPSSWPLDAIEAQIVAARTFALYHLAGGVYDFDDTTAAQVYGGLDRESAAQNAAVAGTRGQAIFYGGQIIDAVFSSSDGGHTQCASAEWGSTDNPCTPAYLKGVIDNFDVSPLHTWYTPPHSLAEIEGYLGTTYNSSQCGTMVGFDLSDRDASDRLNHVRMIGTRGTCTVTPGVFIRAINAGSPADFVVYGEMFGVTTGRSAWPYW